MAHTDQLEPLAERLIAAAPKLDLQAQRIGLALIRELADGRPVSDHAIAVAVGAAESGVRDALGRWLGVFRNEEGLVIGFMA